MNRYSAGHQKLRLGVLLLPIVPFGVIAAKVPVTRCPIGLIGMLALFFLGLAIHLGLVVIHELGHVLAAALFRIPLRGFTIGHWRRLTSFKVRGVVVEIRAVPDVGYVVPAVKPGNVALLPLTLFLLGGVIAEAVVFGVVFFANAPTEPCTFGDVAANFARVSTLWFTAVHVVANLLPVRGSVGGDSVASDGMQLLHLWRHWRELPKKRALSERLAPVDECLAKKRYAEAGELLRALAREYPDHLRLTELLGQMCVLSGETTEAERIYRQLLEKYPDDKLKRAELLDSLICLALFRDRPDLLEEAKGWMTEALVNAPDAFTLKGTKASMDVALGRYDEAISTIPTLLRRVELDSERAYLAAALAEAYAGKGDAAQAKHWFQLALAADADCPGVKRATRTLASAGVM